MICTRKYLHLTCKISLYFEQLRRRLIDSGDFKNAKLTYQNQKVFLPGSNSPKFWDSKFDFNYAKNPMEQWRIDFIKKMIKDDQKILNLGVGRGELEKKLIINGNIDYTGTDITSRTIQRLKQQFPAFKFKKENLKKLTFKSNSFDLIILTEVLEHIIPSETFIILSEIFRVLKKSGMFIISVPVNEGLENTLPLNPNSHMRLYSERLILYELTTAGFKVTKMLNASAFSKNFLIKSLLNSVFSFRKPNNLLIVCQK
jgi:ubiquinone/menaquinone biosynthesis C-methylase UbiE